MLLVQLQILRLQDCRTEPTTVDLMDARDSGRAKSGLASEFARVPNPFEQDS